MAIKLDIRDRRIQCKLTQKDLAQKTGISLSYIRRIEQTEITRLSTDLLEKLCTALECKVGDILIHTDD